jgi:hypothetical protein
VIDCCSWLSWVLKSLVAWGGLCLRSNMRSEPSR